MKLEEVDPAKLEEGEYCCKGVPFCFCAVGYPYEMQCKDCRDNWKEGEFRNSYCICPPPEGKC